MEAQTVEIANVIDDKPQANASQMGLTTFVLTGLYKTLTFLPVMLAVALFGMLGAVAAEGYSLIVFGIVMLITLRESIGVVEHAHLKNDNILGDLKALAAKVNFINALALGAMLILTLYAPTLLSPAIATGIILGLVCAACSPLFGIAGINYLLGASRVDTNKIATLNKYASLNAGIICSLSFFLIKNPTDVKLLGMMALVSFFSMFLFQKTNTPAVTVDDWQQTRDGASNYDEPALNLGYFMILFVAAAILLLYSASQDAGGITQLLANITKPRAGSSLL